MTATRRPPLLDAARRAGSPAAACRSPPRCSAGCRPTRCRPRCGRSPGSPRPSGPGSARRSLSAALDADADFRAGRRGRRRDHAAAGRGGARAAHRPPPPIRSTPRWSPTCSGPDGWTALVADATARWTRAAADGSAGEQSARLRAELAELRGPSCAPSRPGVASRSRRRAGRAGRRTGRPSARAAAGPHRRAARGRARARRQRRGRRGGRGRRAGRGRAAARGRAAPAAQRAITELERSAEAARREARDRPRARRRPAVAAARHPHRRRGRACAASWRCRPDGCGRPTRCAAAARRAAPARSPTRRRWTGCSTLPQVHLIVDGYNVTKTGYGELPLVDQRTRLVTALAALAARTGPR